MAMDPLSTSMPMYDPRRSLAVHNILHNHNNSNVGNGNNTGNHPKPDSTVPSPPAVNSGADLINSNNKSSSQSSGHGGDTATTGNGNGDTLADLANSEISLDLQGLIDDAHFGADAENLFGDLIDNGQNTKRDYVRLSPVNSLGSSANSSPGNGGNGTDPSQDPNSFSNNYRSLAYLPGSVHGASMGQNPLQQQQQNPNNNTALPSITTLGNAVFVKQEPEDYHMKRQMQHVAAASAVLAAAGQNNANTGYVSSTTHMNGYNLPNRPLNGQPNAGQQASQPNTNASQLAVKFGSSGNHKYPSSNPGGSGGSGNNNLPGVPATVEKKKRSDRSSDEYRRRRERNNVAVRKSREKAKVRTRDTEDRVKILARENERLQKKVELLQEELAVLRSLFSNVGVLPDHIHRELSKHIDNFQQQHNAMACM